MPSSRAKARRILNELEGKNIIAGLTWLDRRPKSFDLLTDAVTRKVPAV